MPGVSECSLLQALVTAPVCMSLFTAVLLILQGRASLTPLGTIYSVAMMLRYSLDQDAAADAIEAAIDRVLEKGYRTPDLCGEGLTKVSTSQMGQLIAAELA